MPPAPRSLNPFRVLGEYRNFRVFWTGQTLSLIGSWGQTMALGWLALELTDDALLVSLVSAVGALPILLFSLHAGAIADRVNKLHLVAAMQTLMLLEATLLWWVAWSDRATIGVLIALAGANGIFSAFEIPARQALLVDLVARDDLPDAIALNSSGFNLARIVGPSVAALTIAHLGLAWCFALNALSYLAVLGGLGRIRLPASSLAGGPRAPRVAGDTGRGVREGLRYLRTTPEVSQLMRLVTVFAVCGTPYLTLMPVVARDQLRTGASGYGVLLACVGVGGLAGALFLASVGARIPRGALLAGASFAFAALLLTFAFVRSVSVARPLLLAIGFTMIINSAVTNGALQAIVPDAFRGRLMAAYSFVVVGLSQVVGAFAAGSLASAIGVDGAIGGAAAVMLAYAGWVFVRHPELRRLGRGAT